MASLNDIQILADKIAREFRAKKVILFGSHARGGARPDPDAI
jgi:predicted nucleotidyltransferase